MKHLLLEKLIQESAWKGKDAFPTKSYWDDYEGYLQFLKKTGGLNKYWGRLTGPQTKQRDDAFAEIIAAKLICDGLKMKVKVWQPNISSDVDVDFILEDDEGNEIYIQVKRPSWEAEVVKDEGYKTPRLKQPKYINAEARWVGNETHIKEAIDKAYMQLPNTKKTGL